MYSALITGPGPSTNLSPGTASPPAPALTPEQEEEALKRDKTKQQKRVREAREDKWKQSKRAKISWLYQRD